MSFSPDQLAAFIAVEFEKVADKDKALGMAAYMKTTMPFYGIQKPLRATVYKEMKRRFVPTTGAEYEAGVRALWQGSHREDKYAAIEFARQYPNFICSASMNLYEFMIRSGAWWDFVDDIAQSLVGEALRKERTKLSAILDRWIEDDDMWIRRTAILAHNRHKSETDEEQLYRYCLQCADEKEFFIRKAIGWALRQYSYTRPESVKRFVKRNRHNLSALSIKEGLKQINRAERP